VGKWVFEEFPNVKAVSYKRWVEVVETGLPATEEVCYIKDGKERWFNMSYAKFGDGFINTWQEITERKTAEKKLKEQTTLYESLIQAQSEMGEGISILEGLKFVYVNDALCNMYGYKREELLGMNCDELFLPEDREKLGKRHDQRVHTTYMPSYGETRVQRKDGTVIDIGYTVKHMNDPLNAKKLIQISIIRDITEKKRAEERLLEQSIFIREVAGASPDVIHVYDLEKNKTVYLNRDIYEDIEFPARELEKMSLEEQGLQFLHPDDLLKLESFMQQIAAAKDTDTVCNEIRLKGRDGSWHHFLSKAKVFKRNASGKVTQYLAIRTKIAVTN
jgi:PAS domain S-box-containing protein